MDTLQISQELSQEIKQLVADDTGGGFMASLAARWEEEQGLEDFQTYQEAIKTRFPYLTIKAFSTRPFGFFFSPTPGMQGRAKILKKKSSYDFMITVEPPKKQKR